MSKWNSRKFWTMVAFAAVFTVLLTLGTLGESSYVSLQTILLLAYFGANVGQRFAENMRK